VKNKGKDGENIAEGTARSAGTAAAAESYDDATAYAVADEPNEEGTGEAQREAAKIRRTKQKTAEQCCGGF
jgi:hypothetical protein